MLGVSAYDDICYQNIHFDCGGSCVARVFGRHGVHAGWPRILSWSALGSGIAYRGHFSSRWSCQAAIQTRRLRALCRLRCEQCACRVSDCIGLRDVEDMTPNPQISIGREAH